jgi:hypothetical protein
LRDGYFGNMSTRGSYRNPSKDGAKAEDDRHPLNVTLAQDVDFIHQRAQTFRRPAIPHSRCAEVSSRTREHPRRGTRATRPSQEHRGAGDPVSRRVGHSVSMYLPGWTGLSLECTPEAVEGLDSGAFPDIRCGCAETRCGSSLGHSRYRLTMMTRNPPSGYRKVRCAATSGTSEPPEPGRDPGGCDGYGPCPLRVNGKGLECIDCYCSGTLVLRIICWRKKVDASLLRYYREMKLHGTSSSSRIGSMVPRW